MSEPFDLSEPPKPRRRRPLFLAGIALAAALVGAAGSQAWSHGHRMWHGHGMMRLGGPMMGADITPAEAEKHAERMARHFAVEVDATGEQEAKLKEIAKGFVREVLPLREKVQSARSRGVDILGAATVDRGAIERLRAEQIANAETFSRRMAQALADVAEVLTPEQRRAVTERIRDWRERRGWFGPRRG